MKKRVIVDTSYFYALFDQRDDWHESALEKQRYLDEFSVIVPWPVLYETLGTRFVKRQERLIGFAKILRKPDTEIVDDSPYREAACRRVMDTRNSESRESLVDTIILALMDDEKMKIDALLAFNARDFRAFCFRKSISYL